ncbi:MAG: tol-pal system YbgF family protein [Nitrospinaceae bacterium]
MNPPRRLGFWIAGLVAFMALTGVLKVMLNGEDEMRLGESAMQAGHAREAADHFERAIRWRLPGSNWQDQAASRLWNLAAALETQGDSQAALNLYRRLRGAFYATTSVFTPGKEWIHRANEKIASLMAGNPPNAAEEGLSVDQRRRQYLSLLNRDRPPHAGWALVAEAGFFGWVGSLVGLILQAFSRTGEWRPRQGWVWLSAFSVFYLTWVFGLAGV